MPYPLYHMTRQIAIEPLNLYTLLNDPLQDVLAVLSAIF